MRRADITWRQKAGASATKASEIAQQISVNMTNNYTNVQLKNHEELTRVIQGGWAKRQKKWRDCGKKALEIAMPQEGTTSESGATETDF